MKLSTVFELLLICLLIAFAAYGRVIDHDNTHHRLIRSTHGHNKQDFQGISIMSLKQATDNVNKYCECMANVCNCCRGIDISFISTNRQGCISLKYGAKDNLAVQLSLDENILTNTVIDGKKAQAICVPMPGGFSKFCSRVYSIDREDDDHFKACLGFELQSSSKLEASMRVSCFRFGSDGIKLRPAEEYPLEIKAKPTENDDDDDDDDDIFGLDDIDDDDDDDDDNDTPSKNPSKPTSQTEEESDDDEEEDDDDDYSLGFSDFLELFTDDSDSSKKKTTTSSPLSIFTIPVINKVTTEASATLENHSIVPTLKPSEGETVTSSSVNLENLDKPQKETTHESDDKNTETSTLLNSEAIEAVTETSSTEKLSVVAEESNDMEYVTPLKKPFAINKITVGIKEKKPSITSNSVNAIKNDIEKPSEVVKPDSQHHELESNHDDVNDDDDDEEIYSEEHKDDNDDEDEEHDDEKQHENASIENEDEEDIVEDDDDDDDNDDIEVLSVLMSDDNEHEKEKGKKKKVNKIHSTTEKLNDEDSNYDDVADLLSRNLKKRR